MRWRRAHIFILEAVKEHVEILKNKHYTNVVPDVCVIQGF